MASYNTIPAAAEDSLLAPKKNNKIKGLVAGAAIAAFVLGAVAATAVQVTPAKEVVNLSKGGDCNCAGGTAPDNYADLRKCLDEKKGCSTITLGKGDFWLGAPQYAIPKGTTIKGNSGDVTETIITAAGPVNEETDCKNMDQSKKIGFLLGDNTKVQDFTYVSLDTNRLDMGGSGLCGGFVFETPGCIDSNCENGDFIYGADGETSISNAQISNIFITGKNDPSDTSPCWWDDWANDDCTAAPQGSLFIPWGGQGKGCTSDVTMTGVTMLKSWADSFNLHGCAHDIKIAQNTMWYPGDDNAGIWSLPKDQGDGLRNIFIQDNDFSQVRNTESVYKQDGNGIYGDYWGSCMAVYGFRDKLVFSGNICRGKWNVDERDNNNGKVHGAVMFSSLFCGDDDDHIYCKGSDMYPDDASSIYITGTTFFDKDDSNHVKPGEQVGEFPDKTWQTCGAHGEGKTRWWVGQKNFPRARINNCFMGNGGWDNDSGAYGCSYLCGNQPVRRVHPAILH